MSKTSFDVSAFAYAHRGLWGGDIPENSLRAFEAASRAGLGCELDVRVTVDQKLVVFHDATLERMCGQPERIDQLDARAIRMIPLPDGSRIPTLEEAFEAMAGMPTLVEMKIDREPDGAGLRSGVAPLVATLNSSNAPAAVMSFDEPTMWRIQDSVPQRPLGLLIEPDEPGQPGAAVEKARRAAGMKYTYLAPHHSVLEPVSSASSGLPLVCWTVRTPAELIAARKHSAAPIFEGLSPALAKSFANTI